MEAASHAGSVGWFWESCPLQGEQHLLMVLPWVSRSCLYCSPLLVPTALLWVPLALMPDSCCPKGNQRQLELQ